MRAVGSFLPVIFFHPISSRLRQAARQAVASGKMILDGARFTVALSRSSRGSGGGRATSGMTPVELAQWSLAQSGGNGITGNTNPDPFAKEDGGEALSSIQSALSSFGVQTEAASRFAGNANVATAASRPPWTAQALPPLPK